jgi:hypothetical protein
LATLVDLSEPARVPHRPFAWQDGRRLWLLDDDGGEWILAELLFDPDSCRYLEVRRASYRWPREAAGALLGRTFACGQRQTEEAARELAEWAARVTLPEQALS